MTSVVASTAAAVAVALSSPVVVVNYPGEGLSLPNVKGEFILGNVQPPTASLTINGREVKVHPKGGFLAFLPVQGGDFTFHCAASEDGRTGTLDRRIHVDAPWPSPDSKELALDRRSLQPAADLDLRPGDWVRVSGRGPGGMKGTFRIYGVAKDLPLVESEPGLYNGGYVLKPGDEALGATIRLFLEGPLGKLKVDAPGHLTVLQTPPAVAAFDRDGFELNNVRASPGEAFILFAPNGVKAVATGHVGDETRIELSRGLTGWIPTNALRLLPEGTPLPRAEVGSIDASRAPRSSKLGLEVSEQVPFTVEELPGMVRLTLYDAVAHTNWIRFDPTDANVKEVRWTQEEDGVVRVDVWLGPEAALAGYNAAYLGGRLELELRWPPPPPPAGKSALLGVTIVLDPGHSPSDPGRVGPMGTTERQHNLRTAQVLADLLTKDGANVIMTRTTNDEEVSLQRRVDIAWEARADALVSLHNNALPDGTDPFAAAHGFNVFFSQPHSRALAEAIHRAYVAGVPLEDEGLKFGDLFVIRSAKLPAALVESAYFIFPEQEQLLLEDAFQEKLGKALFAGLKEYFREVRHAGPEAAPKPKPKPKKAAPSKKAAKRRPGGKKTASGSPGNRASRRGKPDAHAM